ncbi:transcription factor A, mitochondrial [Rana temporaria]|uniref:transcription factor A, mitochondrial n=1 Tax=Rana temporaria TaxID=8407 RepID=UPI001AADB6EA|nr:transcription factor A, mitochondrial [Rana temporaria]
MVSLLSRGVGVLAKALAGLRCSQAARCSNFPSALSTVQCTTARWFSKNPVVNDFPRAHPPKEPPKRPLSSFFRFSIQQRPLLTRQYPEASAKELCKILGNEWRALSEAERQIYLDAARVDILKYREMYKQYKASLDPLDLEVLKEKRGQVKRSKEKRRQRKESKLLGRPKRSRNPFNFYLSEHFNETEGNTLEVKTRHLIRQWENMPSSKKQVYLQLAEDDKVRYQNELKAWEEQMIEIGREDLVREKIRKHLLKETFVWAEKESGKKEKKSSKPAEGRTRGPKKHEE